MTTMTTILCDGCGKEIKNAVKGEYMKLTLKHLDDEVGDFCSSECACNWLITRLRPKHILGIPDFVPGIPSNAATKITCPGAETKMRTGNPRLDDLLFGGFPKGSNILIMGPAFIGKEVLTDLFLVEGRASNTIVINTDCSPEDVEEELQFVGWRGAPLDGVIGYIDVYSKPMGLDTKTSRVVYIDDPTNYDNIIEAMANLINDKPSRLVIRSLSTMLSCSENRAGTEVYRFLQQFMNLVKKTDSVALYLIDPGMHTDTEIQTLQHLTDGAIEFKTNGVKTFLSIQGIGDCQSRCWIQYQYSKKELTLGSFALDKLEK